MSAAHQKIEKIVESVMADLESNINPFFLSWKDRGGFYNPITGNSYSGSNIFWCAIYNWVYGKTNNKFSTFNNFREYKGQALKSGAKGNVLFKYTEITKEDKNGEKYTFPVLNFFVVHSWDDLTEGAKEYFTDKYLKINEDTNFLNQEVEILELFNRYTKKQNINIIESNIAAYGNKVLKMPIQKSFVNNVEYIATFAHELIHSTGTALKRTCYEKYHESDDYRAEEELIAELGANLICAKYGIEYKEQNTNNTFAYLKQYAKVLKDNPTRILATLKAAAKAVEYIEKNS